MNQDINTEEVLKLMATVEGANEYMITNGEGIPIKKSAGISAERALHISFLVNDYWATARKIIHNDLKQHDNVIQKIRIRTQKEKEIIIIQSFHGEATLYLIQNCETKIPEQIKNQNKADP